MTDTDWTPPAEAVEAAARAAWLAEDRDDTWEREQESIKGMYRRLVARALIAARPVLVADAPEVTVTRERNQPTHVHVVVRGTPVVDGYLAEDAARVVAALHAEVEQLRRWKAEAVEVLGRWEDVWQALGRPGPLGRPKSEGVLAEVERLDAAYQRMVARNADNQVRRDEARDALAAVAALADGWESRPDDSNAGACAIRLRAVLADHAGTWDQAVEDVIARRGELLARLDDEGTDHG